MRIFYAIVHKDPNSAYGVSFPDLPGCFSAADRRDDIVSNAREAVELWSEDQPDIEPSSREAIEELAKDELAEGAFIIEVPVPQRRGPAFSKIAAGLKDAIAFVQGDGTRGRRAKR